MTNGGLLTTRSKRSPATGSSIDPDRTSHVALVERGVEPREGEGALGEVGDDDAVGVVAEVQRLDAAPGAEVERPRHGTPDRPLRERRRRAADAEDVVLAHRRPGRDLGEVGRDPPVPVVGRVGADVEAGDDAVALLGDETQRDGARQPQRRQRAVDLGDVDGVPEGEEPDEGGRGGRGGAGHTARGQRLLAGEGAAGEGTEDLQGAGDGEVGGGEVGAERGRRGPRRRPGPERTPGSRAEEVAEVGLVEVRGAHVLSLGRGVDSTSARPASQKWASEAPTGGSLTPV